jgi:hypothetical protein
MVLESFRKKLRHFDAPLTSVLGIPGRPLIGSLLAMLLMALLVRFSSKRFALESGLPSLHSETVDRIYLLLEPTVLLAVSIVVTFYLIVSASPFGRNSNSKRLHRFRMVITSVLLSCMTLAFLVAVENFLKKGLARARPVARTEHFIIAAALDGTLPSELIPLLKPDLFECEIGRALFSTPHRTVSEVLQVSIPNHTHEQVEQHIRSIQYREGIGPYTFDVRDMVEDWLGMSKWRQKKLQSTASRLLDPRKVCDLTGSAPSGHVLRQGFVFFLFCTVLVGRKGFRPWKWPTPWAVLLFAQLACLLIAAASRLYGYDHTLSDEMISLALTAGVLGVGTVVPLVVGEAQRRGVASISEAARDIARVTAAGDLCETTRAIADSIFAALNADFVHIYPFDADTNLLALPTIVAREAVGPSALGFHSRVLEESVVRKWLDLGEVQYYPFDTGALAGPFYGNTENINSRWQECRLDGEGELMIAPRLVQYFFGSNGEYLRGDVRTTCSSLPDPFPWLIRFLSHVCTRHGSDQRQYRIECQTKTPLSFESLIWVGYPETCTVEFGKIYDRRLASISSGGAPPPHRCSYKIHKAARPSDLAAILQHEAEKFIRRRIDPTI